MTDEDGRDHALTPTLFWVAAYLVERVFAGPEEGGWWADLGALVTDPATYGTLAGLPAAFLTEDAAEAHAEQLRTRLPELNQGRRPLHSALSTGLNDVLVIAAPTLPAIWPEQPSRYA